MASVELRSVTRHYESSGIPAIEDISLYFPDTSLTALLGPSGSGKTTLLRLIAGLEYPDSGDILIGDKIVTHMDPKERNVALVFQQYALYPHLTVRDNIGYPLKVLKQDKADQQRQVEAIAARLGLTPLLERMPAELSGGEQQRVAVGRALVREPDVFLLDEPFSNLDAALRWELRAELRTMQSQRGITTIFVTHDQSEAMALADSIVLLRRGRVEQIGTPDELYDQPANMFVAGFIGDPPMNLLPAKTSGAEMLIADVWRMPLPWEAMPNDFFIGLRPEAIMLGFPADTEAQAFPVLLSEAHGNEAIVSVTVGDEVVRVRTDAKIRPAPGTLVTLSASLSDMHFFDETGDVIARE